MSRGFLTSWERLPPDLRVPEVRPYYDALAQKERTLAAKRCWDVAIASGLCAALSPIFAAAALLVKLEDPASPVFFRQERVTRDGRSFYIWKFRTMRPCAAGMGVTLRGDSRVTNAGRLLRRLKWDELPQLWNVLRGEMSLVGPRPELPRYVAAYTPAMRATLLVPAGITSTASLRFHHEECLIPAGKKAERVYLGVLLPEKMADNLSDLERLSLGHEAGILVETACTALGCARLPRREIEGTKLYPRRAVPLDQARPIP